MLDNKLPASAVTCNSPGLLLFDVPQPLQGVCHRDLKLENTLLDGRPAPRLKICDFGYSKVGARHNFQPTVACAGCAAQQVLPPAAAPALRRGLTGVRRQAVLAAADSTLSSGMPKRLPPTSYILVLPCLYHSNVQSSVTDSTPKTTVGTPAYIAPEVFSGDRVRALARLAKALLCCSSPAQLSCGVSQQFCVATLACLYHNCYSARHSPHFCCRSTRVPTLTGLSITAPIASLSTPSLPAMQYEGEPADVWSCGVALYTMLVGAYPFQASRVLPGRYAMLQRQFVPSSDQTHVSSLPATLAASYGLRAAGPMCLAGSVVFTCVQRADATVPRPLLGRRTLSTQAQHIAWCRWVGRPVGGQRAIWGADAHLARCA